MNRPYRQTPAALVVLALSFAPAALAQNGLSDDRVSLPDGPGSIGGTGENTEINPNLGSSSYRVPIQVPEGATANMTPQLALTYSSSQGLGLAGIGWDVSTPVIERMVAKGLPEYDTEDLFTADGSELVYVGDADGTREYRARFEGGFARYRWHQAAGGAAGYWTAEYPDGRTGWFGARPDGTLVPTARVTGEGGETFRYHLVEVQDAAGRRVVQTFLREDGFPRLDEIQYGFGGEATPRFSVRLGYEDRDDVTSDATPGHVIAMTKRLSEIAIYSSAQRVRRYLLSYEAAADAGGMSRLAQVRVEGRDGGILPIVHSFGYSRSLGGACEIGCEQPFLVDMGTLPGGVSVATGRAGLIDINGDSLPDVVASDGTGDHTFHISSLAASGQPAFTEAPIASTMGGTALQFVLGQPQIQMIDVNGDGFTDIVDQQNATALCNFGNGDWESTDCAVAPDQLPTLPDDPGDATSEHDPLGMRFFDYDNDKRMDLLQTAGADSTLVYANTGAGFQSVTVTPIGVRFDVERLELSDMNGDGLQDPVQLVAGGTDAVLRTSIHLGFGDWVPFVDVTVAGLSDSELDNAELEDIDGDGLSDVVVVAGTTISYWRNLNDNRFAARVDITSAMVDGGIPDRDGTQTVLFADMNGNGTDDVVYISGAGQVQFVELFPVRPNLLARVENGIGWVQLIHYGTAIAERTRDEGTVDEWAYKNPMAMVVAKETDTWVTATGDEEGVGLHEVTRFRYRDAYYDPAEKRFRGFEQVERELLADAMLDSQDPRLEQLTYDVGQADRYFAGKLLSTRTFGGPDLDAPLREVRTEYGDCDLGGDLATLTPPVRFVCATARVVILQEGLPQDEWVTTRTETEYDVYGNVTTRHDRGVVSFGPPKSPLACGACEGPPGLDSGPCGATCSGDERVVETTWVTPGPDTQGAWLLRLPVRELSSNGAGGDQTETVTYYDGPGFLGLAEGQATRGLPTRTMVKVADNAMVPTTRSAYDEEGNLIATVDANADLNDATTHRRDYSYDDRGLRVTQVRIQAGDYQLVQDVSYESSFLKASEATAFYVEEDGAALTNPNSSRFRYDEFGRVDALIKPGDSDADPTTEITYELADPVSRIVSRTRRTPGGPLDVEDITCVDGQGRTTQKRRKVADQSYLVTEFQDFNARGAPVREYLPYASSSGACEAAPPAGVGATAYRYDALNREVEATLPDESDHTTASVRRTVYLPLAVEKHDEEDTDSASPHAGTPLRELSDGLGRTVGYERLLEPSTVATYRLAYDETGSLAEVVDPEGRSHVQAYDLAGRVTSVTSPHRGTFTYAYDAAGNLTSATDPRGRTVVHTYDALNRPVLTYEEGDEAGTREETRYDYDAACDDCRNAAGNIVGVTYPGGEDALGYDPRGRRVLVRRSLDGATFETTYTFDGASDLVEAAYPDGQTLHFTYDAASRPVAIEGLVSSATYIDEGQLEAIDWANGVSASFGYDALLRPAALAFGDFYDISVERDRAGQVLEVGSAGSGLDRGASYTYDSWYRLTEAEFPGETLALTYGLDDNILSKSSSLGADSPAHVGDYSYDPDHPGAVSSAGAHSYTYDEMGQATTRGELSLSWDHLGRLTRAEAPGEEPARFTYAPDGFRAVKEERGGRSYYPARDFVVRDGISTLYARLGAVRVARLQSDALAPALLPDADQDDDIDIADAVLGAEGEAADRLLRAAARRVLFEASDPILSLHEDLQGSVVAATDESGALVAERDFYPFGVERAATGHVDVLGFTGQELDETTGLAAFQFRYLDPTVGRWMSFDPAFGVLDEAAVGQLGESTAGFAYVGNRVINRTDPSGLLSKKLAKAARGFKKKFRSRKKKLQSRSAKLYAKRGDLNRQQNKLRAEASRLRNEIRKADTRLRTEPLIRDVIVGFKQDGLRRDSPLARNPKTGQPIPLKVEDYSAFNGVTKEWFDKNNRLNEVQRQLEEIPAQQKAIDARIQRVTDKLQKIYERPRPTVSSELNSTFGVDFF